MISNLKNVVLQVAKQKAAFSLQNVIKVLTTDITKPTTTTTTTGTIAGPASRNYATTPDSTDAIVDIDGDSDSMMVQRDDDDEVSIAPTDIDAWADDEDAKQGTFDIDDIEKPVFDYPPIPQKRSGVYEFRGIKIMLPQKMLQNSGTYRWRVDPEDKSMICDDMRICNFEPIEPKEKK